MHIGKRSLGRDGRPANERTRRLLASSASAIVLVAGAVAAVAYSAVSGRLGHTPAEPAPPGANASVISVRLPDAGSYQTLSYVRGHLLLSGGAGGSPLASAPATGSPGLCHTAVVDPTTLALARRATGPCEDPQLYSLGILALLDNLPGVVNGSTLRLARAGVDGKVPKGPVLLRYTDLAGTEPEVAYGAGYMWVYAPLAEQGGTLLAVSEQTGRVVSRTKVPEVSRPLLFANAAGLWFAAEQSLGPRVEPGLYHVAVGWRRPALVRAGGGGQWLAGWGPVVWFGASGGKTTEVYELSGGRLHLEAQLQASQGSPALGAGPPAGTTSYAGAPAGRLWAVTGGPCARSVLEIEPAAGTYREVALLPGPPGCAASHTTRQPAPIAVVGGDLFILQRWGAGHDGALYRVALAG